VGKGGRKVHGQQAKCGEGLELWLVIVGQWLAIWLPWLQRQRELGRRGTHGQQLEDIWGPTIIAPVVKVMVLQPSSAPAHTHTHVHMYSYVRTHTHICTHTHTHTHARTHALTSPAAWPCSRGSCSGARGPGPRSSPV